MKPYEIKDFSGGITDDIWSDKTHCALTLNNFNIKPDKRPLSRPGSEIDNTVSNGAIPAGNQRISLIVNYAKNDQLFVLSSQKVYWRGGALGAYTEVTGPSSNNFLNTGDASSIPSTAEWNKQLYITTDLFPQLTKLYKDGSGNYQCRTVGMPAIVAPIVGIGTPAVNNYVYAFHYEYTYTVGTQTFQELGPTTLVVVPLSSQPSVSTNPISSIPVLTNAGGLNYDTTVIRVFIYRTINNGTNFYKIGSVTNGTTVFNDTFSDASIQTNLPLYTNDGTLDYAQAPQAKFVHVLGNVGYLGYTKDTNGEHPYRLQQSNPDNTNFWPAGFTVDVQDEVKGVKSVDSFPILLTKKHIFRIDGNFDAFGRGSMNPIKIHDSAGCVSHLSCVEAEGYLFWAGNDGFYATDGYKAFKISDHLNSRYAGVLAAMATQTRIFGKFDPTNRRVYWGVQLDSSNSENEILISLDLRWGVSNESTFHTWSGNSFQAASLEVFNDFLYRSDSRGFVFKHDPTIFTDPKVDTAAAAADWLTETIIWTYQSVQMNFGGNFTRKLVPRIRLQASNVGDTTIQISAINDDGRSQRDLKIIRWKRNFVWGDELFVWGNSDCIWDAIGMIDQWRRFPARGLRVSYLQLIITNGLGITANSDDYGSAVIDPVAKTATLPVNDWPFDSVDYFLTTEADGYVRQFQVLSKAGPVITVADSGNFLPAAATYKWELKGYRKSEPLNLLGYNIFWDDVDQNQGAYHVADNGGNA